MECCLIRSLAYSQVTGWGHRAFAARVRWETQGTSRAAHGDGGDGGGGAVVVVVVDVAAACAGNLRMNTGAPLAASVLYYQTLIAGILRGHIAEENREDLIAAGCKDLRAIIYLLALLNDVVQRQRRRQTDDSGHGVAAIQNGLKEVD
jgi:hypothetical protein